MNERTGLVYAYLKGLALQEGVVTYGRLGELFNLPAIAIGPVLLDPITQTEQAAGRPMLTALVYGVDGSRPGQMFFELAREFGCFTGPDDSVSQVAFWEQERRRVYDYWRGNARGK